MRRFWVVLALSACEVDELPVGDGVLLAGCPTAGQATARRMVGDGERMDGDWVLGGPGDLLIMNQEVAFVVQGLGPARAYSHYTGNLIDAVALKGCAQAGPEQFGELNVVVGSLRLDDFPASTLKGFEAQSVEVLRDGSDGGSAAIRVRGRDAPFWLVEHELIRRAAIAGEGKALTPPMGLDIVLDYVLEPGAKALRMELELTNRGDEVLDLITAQAVFPADMTQPMAYNNGDIALGGMRLPLQLPWISWSSGHAAYALSKDYADTTLLAISGVNALADVKQVLEPMHLEPGASDRTVTWVSAAAGEHNDAILALAPHLTQPMPRRSISTRPIRATVVEGGLPLADAPVILQMADSRGRYRDLSAMRSDGEGRIETELPALDPGQDQLRLLVRRPGADEGEPTAVDFEQPMTITAPPLGHVQIAAVDGEGRPMPAKFTLLRDDGLRRVLWAKPGQKEALLPPGSYRWFASRGFEHLPDQGELLLDPGAPVALRAELPRVLDTEGWLATDSHVHSSPSEDSDVPVALRFLTMAANGVEVFVGSDHEIVTDLWRYREVSGLGDWVASVVGQELTATTPEHHTIAGMDPQPDQPRGGLVPWFRYDMAQLHASARARGAQLIGLNHPRLKCNWLCLIGWDRLSGEATATDASLLGLWDGAALFSDDFDFIEVMNGPKDPFIDPENPEETGVFEDWQAMLNHGRRVTGVGSSDVHGIEGAGDARTYLRTGASPSNFAEVNYIEPMLSGAAVISAGAFADVRVGHAGPGDEVSLNGGELELAVTVQALPQIDVSWLLVTYNCDELLRLRTDAPDALVKIDRTLRANVDRDGHLAVMGFGSQPMPTGLSGYEPSRVPRFISNAIYVDADGDGQWTPPGGKTCTYTLEAPVP